MNEEEFIKNRLDDQINWYENKSKANKIWFLVLKTSEIVLAIIIPFLSGYIKDSNNIKYAIGGIGLVVAIIAGVLALFKFPEKWIEYRTTAETLKHEKFMFLTKAGFYKSDSSLQNLAERTEVLISKENSNWNQMMNKKDEKPTKAV